MDKITYRSRAGDMDIPAFVFRPLKLRGAKGHPAIVWVHENIRGHLYEHYIPFIRDATARGFVVIAPEYRGSIGYGKTFYDAIDYGGAEVDDVVTAVSVLTTRYPQVDPSRVAMIGWSHGGMITLLSVFRNPVTFKAAVAIVPVANLFQRLASKGVEQRRVFDPQNVGYDIQQSPFKSGSFTADPTNANGNGNQGHEYGTDLKEDQRRALLEYLKTL